MHHMTMAHQGLLVSLIEKEALVIEKLNKIGQLSIDEVKIR